MLRRKGGTEPILADPDIKEMFVPIIQADVQLEETYAHQPSVAEMPILAVRGGKPGRDKEKTLIEETAAQLWVDAGTAKSRVCTLAQHDWYLLEDQRGAEDALREVDKFVTSAVVMP